MKYLKLYESYIDIGAGILPFCKKTGRFLVGLRSKDVTLAFTWGNFGGKLENEKNIEVCALRELKEETKYKGEITLVKGYIFKERQLEYHNYIGIVPDEFKPKLNWEHTKAKWLTLEELYQLPEKHFGLQLFLEKSYELDKFVDFFKNNRYYTELPRII